ncbi:MAG: DMT family transporter [Ruminococcus sp.]|jgi:drug/metabolite transporter (DMT)-like permease
MEKNKNVLTRPAVVCGLALLCTFLWGSAFPCVKVGYKLFSIADGETGSQILFAGYRFTLAGILTWLISTCAARRPAFPVKAIRSRVVLLGLIQTTMQYLFFYIGLSNTTGVKGSIITAANSFFSILLAHFMIRGEKMTLRKGIGCLLGFAGVVVINFSVSGFGGGFSLTGEGFMLISCFAYALAAVYVKTFADQDNPFTITAYQLLIGGVLLIFMGLAMGGQVHGFTVKSSLLLFYMALISSVAFSVWTLLLKYNPVGTVSIYGFTNPVFGVILSALFLGEKAFTLQNLAALVLVSLGIIIVNRGTSCHEKKNPIQ